MMDFFSVCVDSKCLLLAAISLFLVHRILPDGKGMDPVAENCLLMLRGVSIRLSQLMFVMVLYLNC